MSPETTRRKLLGGIAGTGIAALAGCTGMTPFVGQQVERTERISPDDAETLAVHGSVGDVSVVGGDRDEIELDVEKQSSSIRTDLDDLVLRTERTDDRLELRSEYEGGSGWFESHPSMNLDVDLPEELALEAVRTSVGRITVRDVTGDLAIDTSTGRVDVAGVSGAVGAETSTGRVRIRDVDVLEDVSTSTARVEVDVPAIDGDTTVSTSTGRVEAAIGPDVDAELHVETGTGRIDTGDLELTDVTRGDDLVTGTLGDGGPPLRFETSTGRISLTTLR